MLAPTSEQRAATCPDGATHIRGNLRTWRSADAAKRACEKLRAERREHGIA